MYYGYNEIHSLPDNTPYSFSMKTEEIIKYLEKNKSAFKRKFGVKRIGVFGSSAKGNMHEGIDIDIVVELEKPDMFALIGIKQTIEEELQANVDIVRYRDKMNHILKMRIDKEAVYV
jgi:uncharacterized protein